MKYIYKHILVGSVSLKNPDKSSLCVTDSLLPGQPASTCSPHALPWLRPCPLPVPPGQVSGTVGTPAPHPVSSILGLFLDSVLGVFLYPKPPVL